MPKKILFIHIPKTGGTTVNGFIEECLSPAQCFNFIDVVDYRSANFFKRHRFYSGHIRLSQALPYITRDGFYIFTVLRDPVQQIFSHLSWAKNKTRPGYSINPEEWDEDYLQLFQDISDVDIFSARPLGNFIESRPFYRRLFDNQETRFLLDTVYDTPLSDAHFKEALNTLKKFNFVGITEKLAETLGKISSDNKLKHAGQVTIKNQNRQRAEYAPEKITPAIRSAVAEYIKYDALLYREVR